MELLHSTLRCKMVETFSIFFFLKGHYLSLTAWKFFYCKISGGPCPWISVQSMNPRWLYLHCTVRVRNCRTSSHVLVMFKNSQKQGVEYSLWLPFCNLPNIAKVKAKVKGHIQRHTIYELSWQTNAVTRITLSISWPGSTIIHHNRQKYRDDVT